SRWRRNSRGWITRSPKARVNAMWDFGVNARSRITSRADSLNACCSWRASAGARGALLMPFTSMAWLPAMGMNSSVMDITCQSLFVDLGGVAPGRPIAHRQGGGVETVKAQGIIPKGLLQAAPGQFGHVQKGAQGMGVLGVGVGEVGAEEDVVVPQVVHHLVQQDVVGLGGDKALAAEIVARGQGQLRGVAPAHQLQVLVEAVQPVGQPA